MDKTVTTKLNDETGGAAAELAEFENPTLHYLNLMRDMRLGMPQPKNYFYRGPEDFVLRCGRQYHLGRLPKGVKPGPPKQCFSNSYNLAAKNPRYTYCEGFATSIIPVAHAWNVDRETGLVVDTTWDWLHDGDEDKPGGYYGVEFPLYVYELIASKSKHHGLIDVWTLGWPLLKEPLPDFEEKEATFAWFLRVTA